MINKDAWSSVSRDPKEEEDSDLMSQEIPENEGSCHEKFVAQVLSDPQKIYIDPKPLEQLMASKEATLRGIDFHGRKIKPGDKIILLDENEVEIIAELAEIVNPKAWDGMIIKVRLLPEEK